MSNSNSTRRALEIERGKYADHAVRLMGGATESNVWYEARPPFHVLKVHYRTCRVPADRLILVRHLPGSTPQDRAYVGSLLEAIPEYFERCETSAPAKVRRHRTASGKYHLTVHAGSLIDDPLAHLELEKLVDFESTVTL